MKKQITKLSLVITLLVSLNVHAQPFPVFATGFSNLIGVSKDPGGNLWVAEAGSGASDSRISMITPAATIYPVIDQLPSFLDTTNGEVSGAWRAEFVSANELMVVVGGGFDSLAGSLMFFNLSGFIPGVTPVLTPADADSIIDVDSYVYSQGFAESDPYSAAFDGMGNIYIADAAANAVVKYETSTQTFSILDTFPGSPNPFGGPPPTFDYVPTRIINNPSGGFFMSNLGAFVPGLGRIVSIDVSGNVTVLDSGLTSVVDIQYDPTTGYTYALQFGEFDSVFNPIMGSAKLFRISSSGTVDMLYTGFGPSPGFVLDGSGGAYVTEIFTGNVLHIADLSGIGNLDSQGNLSLSVSPNPVSSTANIKINTKENGKADLLIKNNIGETVYTSSFNLTNGENNIKWDGRSMNGNNLPGGIYFVTVKTSASQSVLKIIKQ